MCVKLSDMKKTETHKGEIMETTTELHLNTLLGKHRPAGEPTPISEVALGDIVAISSRGQYRTAVVTKIGRTNVTTSYITQGGIDEGRQIIARKQEWMYKGREAFVAYFADVATKNFDYSVEKAAAYGKYDTDESRARHQAIVGRGREAFMAADAAESNEDFDKMVEDVNTKGPEDFATITNRSVREFWVMGR